MPGELLMQDFMPLVEPATELLGAILLLLIGWLIGRIVYSVVHKLLRKLKIDTYFKIEKGPRITNLLSTVIKWTIYLIFISAAVQVAGITLLSDYFTQLVDLIMGLLGGSVVIIISYLIGRYIQKQIKELKSDYSKVVSQVVFLFIMLIAVSIALEVADIPTQLINTIIIILVASVGLGIAIALGFGLRDTVARLAKKYEKKL